MPRNPTETRCVARGIELEGGVVPPIKQDYGQTKVRTKDIYTFIHRDLPFWYGIGLIFPVHERGMMMEKQAS